MCDEKLPSARFSSDVEIAVFRIAQEAINNALRHSQANKIEVHLKSGKGLITLRIVDYGIGFEAREAKGDGLGLNTMAERAHAVGGELCIDSGVGKTTIQVDVPAEPLARYAEE